MKTGIVFKLFFLTTTLCMLIVTIIFVGQTFFFKQYYENRKVQEIQNRLQSFEQAYKKAGENSAKIKQLEQEFYHEQGTWITTLDSLGSMKNATDFLEVQLFSHRNKSFLNSIVHIPLYTFNNSVNEQALSRLQEGENIRVDGIQKAQTVVVARLTWNDNTLENTALSKKIFGPNRIKTSSLAPELWSGTITKLQISSENTRANSRYLNDLFINKINEFQAELLVQEKTPPDGSIQIREHKENNVPYKIFIKPIQGENGLKQYLFAMTSLQPVDEAVQMIKEYYVYLIVVVLLLSILVSLYYSREIAKPLLQINDTTKKMAHLDFSETIPILTKDEIGDLSHNINILSCTLQSYIQQLQQDIEKEKKLEKTRKEFISSVSHELKTPLSVMKSCISVLEDGIANQKKEYYFQAMSKEINKMNQLIVDMLELAQMESGTYKIIKNPFYVDQLIEEICEKLEITFQKKHLHIHKNILKIEVYANQHRIDQVLINFITNAIRHTPEGKNIFLYTIEEKNRIKICIENNGDPIPEDQLDKIWDRFHRVDSSRQRASGGTGLGLAISRNILQLHDAEFGVQNTEKGVLFFFYLPKNV